MQARFWAVLTAAAEADKQAVGRTAQLAEKGVGLRRSAQILPSPRAIYRSRDNVLSTH